MTKQIELPPGKRDKDDNADYARQSIILYRKQRAWDGGSN
jgi:hypothetical protein